MERSSLSGPSKDETRGPEIVLRVIFGFSALYRLVKL